ncbi:MAG: DinB family protein [Acidobacteria bacterium]|nr:DinB family protein [Acidobacteriota bacterium]
MEEQCAECGLDASGLDMVATAARLAPLPAAYRDAVAGLDDAELRKRADERTWSVVEYLAHARDAVRYHGALIRDALRAEADHAGERRVAAIDPDAAAIELAYNDADVTEVLDGIEANFARFGTRISELTPEEQAKGLVRDDRRVSVAFLAHSALHEAWHHLLDVQRLAGSPSGAAVSQGDDVEPG